MIDFVLQVTIIVNAIFYKEPTYNGLPFPQWAKALGWLIVMFPVSSIVLWFAYYYCKKGGFRVSRRKLLFLNICTLNSGRQMFMVNP